MTIERMVLVALVVALAIVGGIEIRNKILVGSIIRPWFVVVTVEDSVADYADELAGKQLSNRKK